MNIFKKTPFYFFCALAFSQVHAQQIYRCAGVAGAPPEYINKAEEARTRNCKLVTGENVTIRQGKQQSVKAKQPSAQKGVSIGMTQAEVIASNWGRPESVNRTTTARGTHEQWVYGLSSYLYFEDGILTAIQN